MPLLTLADLAAILHTTPGALHVRVHHNRDSIPPVIKIPGDRRYLFDSQAVQAWLRSHTQSSTREVRP